jgi:hypothetical protein
LGHDAVPVDDPTEEAIACALLFLFNLWLEESRI